VSERGGGLAVCLCSRGGWGGWVVGVGGAGWVGVVGVVLLSSSPVFLFSARSRDLDLKNVMCYSLLPLVGCLPRWGLGGPNGPSPVSSGSC